MCFGQSKIIPMEAGGPEEKKTVEREKIVMQQVGGPMRRNTKGARIRRAVFTLNNFTDEEYDYMTARFAPKTVWMVIGKEVGEEGTPHLQGNCPPVPSCLKNWSPPSSPYRHGLYPICPECGYRHN